MIDRKSLLDFFNQLFPNSRQTFFIVGVSGGIDSMCLLDCLCKAEIPIIAAHFNHQLRLEAEEDARFVHDMAARYSIPFIYGKGDVAGLATIEHKSIEECARILRYQFLFDLARQHQCRGVVTAHHADDQVETIMMHLMRGSGLEGIKGMLPVSIINEYDINMPLIRPFLENWRSEMVEYAYENSISYREDESNLDTQYYRNRIRKELLPMLETYNPQAKQHLLQTASILGEDYRTLEILTASQYQQAVIDEKSGVLVLSRVQFASFTLGQQRNLLRYIIKMLQPQIRDVDFVTIQSMINWISTEKQNRLETFHKELCLFNEKNVTVIGNPGRVEKWIQNKFPQYAGQFLEVQLQESGAIDLPGGHCLRWDVFQKESPTSDQKFHPTSLKEVWIDLDLLDGPIILRSFSPGDRIEPLGMPGSHAKLSDIFVNAKIPRVIRKTYPVLCSGDQICWLPGLRLSDFCKITNLSRRIARLQWFTPKDQE